MRKAWKWGKKQKTKKRHNKKNGKFILFTFRLRARLVLLISFYLFHFWAFISNSLRLFHNRIMAVWEIFVWLSWTLFRTVCCCCFFCVLVCSIWFYSIRLFFVFSPSLSTCESFSSQCMNLKSTKIDLKCIIKWMLRFIP